MYFLFVYKLPCWLCDNTVITVHKLGILLWPLTDEVNNVL